MVMWYKFSSLIGQAHCEVYIYIYIYQFRMKSTAINRWTKTNCLQKEAGAKKLFATTTTPLR